MGFGPTAMRTGRGYQASIQSRREGADRAHRRLKIPAARRGPAQARGEGAEVAEGAHEPLPQQRFPSQGLGEGPGGRPLSPA